MTENTDISWCTHSWNPWIGCQKVSPGCDHCYAEAMDKRFGGTHWGPGAERRRTSPDNWNQPRKWNRQAEKSGERPRVFCASMADVFDNAVPEEWRADLWQLIRETPNLRWQLLTKRIGNAATMLPPDWPDTFPHVGLMISVVNQEEADRDIPKLLATPAAWRGLSMEPLLGTVDLTEINGESVLDPICWGDCSCHSLYGFDSGCRGNGGDGNLTRKIDWVICGGESGHGARPIHPDWARSLRDQCVEAGVPFHFKQWGEFAYHPLPFHSYQHWVNKAQSWIGGAKPAVVCIDTAGRICRIGADMQRAHEEGTFPVAIAQKQGKKAVGRLLDGREWNEFPVPLNDRRTA